jgi:endoglucanase
VTLSRLLRRSTPRLLTAALVLALCALTVPDGQALAPVVRATSRNTPAPRLASPWGIYTAKSDEAYKAWLAATGTNRTLLAKIALRPRVRWFGTWIPTSQVTAKIQKYVSVSQHGNPNNLVQLATFRLWPNGGEPARSKPLSAADQEAYRAWVRAAARGIGTSRVALVLEPDLAMALTGWRPDVRLALTKYAARVFSALPRTTVYIDASDADWLHLDAAASMLRSAGVAYTRGFALGATHYGSVTDNMSFGRALITKLAAAGIPNRHFVIDTADNGRPFTWTQYYAAHPHGDFDNAETCTTSTQLRCDTLGHPPTWATNDRAHVDAYLWFGRPWLTRQSSPWDLRRALAVTRTTPY